MEDDPFVDATNDDLMIYLLKMVIFQFATLNYQRVSYNLEIASTKHAG